MVGKFFHSNDQNLNSVNTSKVLKDQWFPKQRLPENTNTLQKTSEYDKLANHDKYTSHVPIRFSEK
jgi:hypothetical protein